MSSESASSRSPVAIVVMGVQGTGKTTVGHLLAERIGATFIDGDDLHPQANKEKMGSGHPLDDVDRLPWLLTIADVMAAEHAAGRSVVVACSALKRWYREVIRNGVESTCFVHLAGERDLLAERLSHRNHEFMPPTLLDSQFETLQPLAPWEYGFPESVVPSPEAIVTDIVLRLDRGGDKGPVNPGAIPSAAGTEAGRSAAS